ncbi:MAG TPA: alpha/beta hydrolase-fold protein, partial [Thermoplasmata archaeon]|nr:alpha/beta hydrolase-fold protein [Thermoplasmata archaeon]
VLVGNAAHRRWQELAGNPAFARFVGEELVPLLRREYDKRVPARRIVLAGSSLGALTSCFVALWYPRLFGNVLAQSGAFPWECSDPGGGKSTLMEQYARAPRHAVRFYLDAGTHERFPDPVMGVSLLWSVMHMRDVLEARGYRVHCAEFEGGHDYACWKGTLADGLIHLLGRRAGD